MACCPLASSVRGIFKARILQWVAFPPSGNLPDPGIEAASPALAGGFYTAEPLGKPPKRQKATGYSSRDIDPGGITLGRSSTLKTLVLLSTVWHPPSSPFALEAYLCTSHSAVVLRPLPPALVLQ